MELYNKLSNKERALIIKKANEERLTLSFYIYQKIEDAQNFRNYLFLNLDKLGVLGRIYLANEGINAQLSIPSKKIDYLRKFLSQIPFLKNVHLNIGIEQKNNSFLKLKVKVRNKIVADGLQDNEYDIKDTGTHVSAKEFNDLMEKDETITIDMRNHYESEIGHFKGAICPNVDSFRDSLKLVNKKFDYAKNKRNILMYCTGGIRCEKASALLKHNGYKNVFQLSGGIIEYARQVKESGIENKFLGKNFVFDNRLSERIGTEVIAKCHLCGEVSDNHVNCNNEACHVLFIQCESCHKKLNGCCSISCKDNFELPIEVRKKARKIRKSNSRFFKKGRVNEKV